MKQDDQSRVLTELKLYIWFFRDEREEIEAGWEIRADVGKFDPANFAYDNQALNLSVSDFGKGARGTRNHEVLPRKLQFKLISNFVFLFCFNRHHIIWTLLTGA